METIQHTAQTLYSTYVNGDHGEMCIQQGKLGRWWHVCNLPTIFPYEEGCTAHKGFMRGTCLKLFYCLGVV